MTDVDPVALLGQIDIYLFDQIQRGRIAPGDRIFDAGCGMGRNLAYFLRTGYRVAGADADADTIVAVRAMVSDWRPDLPADAFRVEPLEALSVDPSSADVVIASAVLHFARDAGQFEAMLRGCWRVLRPGGMFFCRLASSIGIEARIVPEHGGRRQADGSGNGYDDAVGSAVGRAHETTGRFLLPDRTRRYLVDEAALMRWTEELGGDLLDPLKTTIVQDQRSMTTWVVRKR